MVDVSTHAMRALKLTGAHESQRFFHLIKIFLKLISLLINK